MEWSKLPQNVVTFKLLDGTMLNHKDRQLVFTAVDYNKKDTLFMKMKNALKKLFGEQSMSSENHIKTESIKQETSCMVNYEESNAGFHKKGGYYQHGRGRRPIPCASGGMQSHVFRKRSPVNQEGNPLSATFVNQFFILQKTAHIHMQI